jgi:hypothetical protein
MIEMMPDSTPEWIEVHKLSADRKKIETEVIYRNGEHGTRYWRTNESLAKETISFADGRQRKYAEFAADGEQVITGYEIRADGTKIWEASVDAKKVVTTTTYWHSGKVFEVELRKVDAKKVDQWFYYQSGAKWEHYVGLHDISQIPEIVQLWNEGGNLLYDHYLGLNESSFDTTYRQDGTLAMKQFWVMRPQTYYYPGMPVSSRRVLLKVEIYSKDGKLLKQEFMMDSGGYYADRVIERSAEGWYMENILLYDGSVIEQTKYDASGKVIFKQRLTNKTTFKIPLPSEAMDSLSEEFDPKQSWRDDEAGISP